MTREVQWAGEEGVGLPESGGTSGVREVVEVPPALTRGALNLCCLVPQLHR